MTEKQFKFDRDSVGKNIKMPIIHVGSCERMSIGEILEKLNELADENKLLKKENMQLDILITNNQLAYIDLEKENEVCKEAYNEIKSNAIHLKEENEQLKHSIKCLEADKMELQQYIKRMQGDVE